MARCLHCQADNPPGARACVFCQVPLSASPSSAEIMTLPTRARAAAAPAAPAAPAPATEESDGPKTPTVHLTDVPVVPANDSATATATVASPAASRMLTAVLGAMPAEAGQLTHPLGRNPPVRAPAAAPQAARPRLCVLRGLRINAEYPIYEGQNLIGRRDDRPVDIDLQDQEPADRVWTSRQHAVIHCDRGALAVEDLNSLNGTFVNRHRVYPGQRRALAANDILQIGTIHLKVTD
jgi:FHA domain